MTFAAQCRFLVMDAFLNRVGPLAQRTALEAEVVEKTGWTLDQVDACPVGRLERLILYWNAKNEWERERIERQTS